MDIIKCLLTDNRCYKTGKLIVPKGVMVHSTGANNPFLRRYVHPASGDKNYAKILSTLGSNKYGNHWNRGDLNVCVHGFIGKDTEGTVRIVQTLPWNMRGWHAGTGFKGLSANDTHISFEICEDDLKDEKYFNEVMDTAAWLCAYLCSQYELSWETVICHSEGNKMGIASAHSDITHWLSRYGKDMMWFRREVKLKMIKMNGQPSDWARDAWEWGASAGITDGSRPQDTCTREELVTMLYRFSKIK